MASGAVLVLVVEGDEDTRKAITSLLRGVSPCHPVEDVTMALRVFRQATPNLVVCGPGVDPASRAELAAAVSARGVPLLLAHGADQDLATGVLTLLGSNVRPTKE